MTCLEAARQPVYEMGLNSRLLVSLPNALKCVLTVAHLTL